MSNYARALLSVSTPTVPIIPVAATAIASGTLLHTAINGTAAQFDEVYIWASNLDTVEHTITMAVGGVTVATQVMASFTLPPNSPPIPLLTGLSLQGGVTVKVAADVTNVVNCFGHVNTIR